MTPGEVQEWLDAYVAAWKSNDATAIAALFTTDATYAYNPWGAPLQGVEAIVADWLREPDVPGSWDARYSPHLVAGNEATAIGETVYHEEGKTYSNLFALRFESGRCAEFVEWFMKHPKEAVAIDEQDG
ncbi:MAG: nuclear transport factor 2 family protein [Acidimicrobiia bacterium]|nr:nuclear transport factor 2 family protein [Acidimicrobiia bacterium]